MEFGFRTDFNDTKLLEDIFKQSEYAEIDFYKVGTQIYKNQTKEIFDSINKYKINKNTLSVKKIEEDFFPIPKDIDIFISHSHDDLEFVKLFAGFLKQYFGFSCFIDSCLWKNIDDLMKIAANELCDKKQNSNGTISYKYESFNKVSSNIHMILSMALTKVIYNSKVFCFIGTANSAKFIDTIKSQTAITFSPWIYLELMISKILSKDKEYFKKFAADSNFSNIKFQYETPSYHLPVLTEDKFVEFIENPSKDLETLKNIITDEISYTLFEE